MDTYTIHFSLAMLATGFWVPAGIWLMLNRHALTVLASVPVEDDQPLPTVSIVIPARNEERNLEQALESVLALDYPDLEIIVVNDRSTDGTGAILEKMAERDLRLTVVTITDLPAGWIGKPYALHMGAQRRPRRIHPVHRRGHRVSSVRAQKSRGACTGEPVRSCDLNPARHHARVFPENACRHLWDLHVSPLQTVESTKSAEPVLHGRRGV